MEMKKMKKASLRLFGDELSIKNFKIVHACQTFLKLLCISKQMEPLTKATFHRIHPLSFEVS